MNGGGAAAVDAVVDVPFFPGPDAERMWRIASRYMSLGIEMAAAVAIGVLGGRWLDRRLGSEPYLFWFGLVVGMGAAARGVWRAVRQARKDM